MSAERFIASRILGPGPQKGSISAPIVKIGIIGIALGVAVMLLTVSIVPGFKREIVNRITGLTTHIAIGSINVNPGNEPDPVIIGIDTLELIRNMPFVAGVQRTLFKNGLLKTSTENEGVVLKGVGEEYDFGFVKKHLREGRLPVFKQGESSLDLLISQALADKMGIKLNDEMTVYFMSQVPVYDSVEKVDLVKTDVLKRRLKVCGIFKTDFADFDEALCFTDIKLLQGLNFWDSAMVGSYEVKVKDFAKLEDNVAQLQDLLGYQYSIGSVKELYFNIFVWLDKLDINGEIIIVLMVLVATINMITALLILILERTNMVGLVKALGMSNVSVRRIFLRISLRLTAKGLFWGNIIGIGLCHLQYHFKLAKLDSDTYYVDYVAVDINWINYLLLNAGTFAVCALMLILPTLIITRLTPVKTLRFD